MAQRCGKLTLNNVMAHRVPRPLTALRTIARTLARCSSSALFFAVNEQSAKCKHFRSDFLKNFAL
jgi:hypothetical protein